MRPWIDRDPIPEPLGYPDDLRVASIWRQTYIACQEVLYAIRHLSIAGRVAGDRDLVERAKTWLCHVAEWDTAGPTSHRYSDEWAFRICLALAWGYDWLHDMLDVEQRQKVQQALYLRTRDIAEHVIGSVTRNPYNSHAIRAVPAVLLPASLALLDDCDEARQWLDFAITFLATVYPPWGDRNGGYAEGPHYWMTAMAYLVDAATLLRAATGIDLFERPFLKETGDFPLYVRPPDTRRASFCDDTTLGDPPGLKMAQIMQQLAATTNNGAYQWFADKVRAQDEGSEDRYFNYGWWDLAFDEMVFRHEFNPTPPVAPRDLPALKWFKGIGWVAFQNKLHDPSQHVHFIFKSSPFGSLSHSHGDQNAFVLSAYGEDLAIQSGHYVAFNSAMHRNWRRQTISKNAILIDSQGQYAGRNKAACRAASGRIDGVETREDHVFLRGDAREAYAPNVPGLDRVAREVRILSNRYFLILDIIDASRPVSIDWLLHFNAPCVIDGTGFRYTGRKAGLTGRFLHPADGPIQVAQRTGFEGVDPAEIADKPESTCLIARFAPAKSHRIGVLLAPFPSQQSPALEAALTPIGDMLHFTLRDASGVDLALEIDPNAA
ncbi:hypothetical protein roselon_01182 [Roseibacterium elongatum DSM 19469]|uniref:Uncharacterized protein n=1 Tax=Roseicyclus elongatus DSM 19469 TaxID=1294273 RepID=W8RR64_9RHOB|nr:hypothetical protein roselon_01182 [Roseibacterium elongatum DSM 19469]